MKENELIVLRELRKESRQHITNIARTIGIPSTTAHDYFKNVRKFIKRFVAMVNFPEVGYHFRSFFTSAKNERLINFLRQDKHVNNLLLAEDAVICEAVFESNTERREFRRILESFASCNEHPVIDELMKEEFLP